MGSGSRVLVSLCCSTTTTITPFIISSSQLRFKSSLSSASRVSSHMAHSSSSSSSSSSAINNPPSPSPSQSIDFLSICHRLKTTKRAGWLRKDVKDSESIADHMYRMGLMALIAPDFPGVDRDKCVKMAIVHDIAEAIVGDITPTDGIPKEEKSRREQEALDHMCKVLGGGSRAKEIAELWTEYEANSSPEAKFVKDLDKVEMILQALEYEDEQGKDLDEFFRSTAGKFQTEIGKAWASEIVSRRNKTNGSSHSDSTN